MPGKTNTNSGVRQEQKESKDPISSIETVIPESHIVVFSPHYDDFLFMLGGYVSEMKKAAQLPAKDFHILLLFSRSNYLARTGESNLDRSLDRLKLATGKRVMEDQECLNALVGEFNYRYELGGETECFARGKIIDGGAMEFPHGMFEDFDKLDDLIFERMKDRIRYWAMFKDTALVFPLAFKEHIDHFIIREAAIAVAVELGDKALAKFYFQEDKPYGGIATETELERTANFIEKYNLQVRAYEYDPQTMIDYAFRYYVSQVEEVYEIGINDRAHYLQQVLSSERPCDQIYVFNTESR